MAIWIFGYGSLIWRPAFAHLERVEGFVHGWTRRFYQASPDHRGTPASPGRVVTLIEEGGARCWGAAYRVSATESDRVLATLDHREQAGYERIAVEVHAADRAPLDAVCYIATRTNPNWLGPAETDVIAAHIARSHGPSGPNTEYALELARALSAMGADDPHVFAIAHCLNAQKTDHG